MTDYKEIGKAMEKSGYRFFGVRAGRPKKVGQYCAYSWYEDDFSHYRLPGTSSTGIGEINDYDDPEEVKEEIEKALEIHKEWSDVEAKSMYVVGGDYMEYGHDNGEYVINNHTLTRRRGARVIALLHEGTKAQK
jgi:hypothetical protein